MGLRKRERLLAHHGRRGGAGQQAGFRSLNKGQLSAVGHRQCAGAKVDAGDTPAAVSIKGWKNSKRLTVEHWRSSCQLRKTPQYALELSDYKIGTGQINPLYSYL